MKALLSLIMLVFTLVPMAFADDLNDIPLTDFKSNKAISLAEFDKSKPTYLKLWATWCQPCMAQMPHFQKLHETYGEKINIIAVNININEEMKYIDDVITKFGLTMPVLLDNEGQLSEALGLVGTPFSVLINTNNDVVYTTHESDELLDTFIAKLAKGETLASKSDDMLSEQAKQKIIAPWQTGNHTLFFTATWCDWYLKDSRPKMANDCKDIQSAITKKFQQSGDKSWHGFVNHLWTDDKALTDFITLYQLGFPFNIDNNGVLFTHFNIRNIPTIIHIENGKVVEKITGDEIKQLLAK
ncbi:hypothetical protein GCM10009111_08210 [Colwellia asteriadis]|uniref:Thioredoxin domain-containing protein n=1 Tax=Colwellia asteriadis TaxID=517723 RepID=A0ABP3WJ70_9GAMM